jgi:hypothetical protein
MGLMLALALVLAIAVAALVVRLIPARRRHDPVEYYRGWTGYSHPIALQNKITKDEADAAAAKGNAYLIGCFDADNRLTRVIKMLKGSVFFDFEYTYHANGRRKSAKVTNANGVVTMREYDEAGRGRPGNPLFW